MRKWKDLSNTEKKDWLFSWEPNGCWAKGWWFIPPKAVFFKASCDIHDWGYRNWVTEEDRKIIDDGFLKYMLIDCSTIECLPKRAYYVLWAYLFYYAVRIFGRPAFYSNK